MDEQIEKAEISAEQAKGIVTAANVLIQNLNDAGIPQAAKEGGEEKPKEDAPAEETTADGEKPVDESAAGEDEKQQKMVLRYRQSEVNYTPSSIKKGATCGGCRWFRNDAEYGECCHIVDNWPLDIVDGGYCDKHDPITLEDFEPTPMEVVVVSAELRDQKYLFERMKDGVVKFIGNVNISPRWRNDTASQDAFMIFKGVDGALRWFARYTNNFEDLEGDIFTEAAHDRYIARVKSGLVPMPELRFWHLKETRHGQATHIERDGHLVMAWGIFDDNAFAEKCIQFYRKNKGKIQLSHGSLVPKWARKQDPETGCRLFTDYNTFEISTLPPVVAKGANPFTTFNEDINMALRPEQKALLVKEFGEEEAARIERANEEINKTIESFAQYKDYADLVSKPGEKAETPAPSAALLGDLYEGQALVVKLAKQAADDQQKQAAEIATLKETHAAEMKAAKETLATLQKDVEVFRAYMNLAPRRASNDPKTALTDEQAAQVEKDIPAEVDPFFGGLGVKQSG